MDTIIHAGDIDNQSVVGQLKNLSSSLIVVRGNADKEWVEHIPQEAWLEILGNKLFVIHNKGRTSCDVGDADIIIYGHSHKYSLVEKDRQIWLNPGCCDKRKKFQMSSKDLQKMKDRSDEICHEHGLSICEKNKTFDGHERTGFTAWTKEKYHFLQDMMEGKSKKSYVYNTMEVVRNSMNRAASQEEFIKLLGDKGYSVDWQDKHKHLAFMDMDGNKVRDTNLNKTFNLGIGKQELLSKFEKNAASVERDKYSHDKCLGIAARIRITEYMDAKADIDKEIKRRDKLIKKKHPFLKEGEKAINSAKKALKKYEKELKECPKILFIKYHDLEEKIAHAQAYIEGTKKNRKAYLNKNGFATLEKYNEYVAETSKMVRASRELDKKIKSEQASFDAVYARLDAEKDISQIVLDPRDVAELKEGLKLEFGRVFSAADIEEANRKFDDYDNGNPSVRRKLNKNKRGIEKNMEQVKEAVIEYSFKHDFYEHDR